MSDPIAQINKLEVQLANANLAHLPLPESAAQQHHYTLANRIIEKIKLNNGAMTFDEFMQAALYEPGYGYYVSGQRKFGPDGDFVTAPEISAVFGQCLARQCTEILGNLDSEQQTLDILEVGAGSGKLCFDLINELLKLNQSEKQRLPDHYYFLETSPDLQQRQQQLINDHFSECEIEFVWLENFPEQFNGIVLANELLDAMPVKRFVIKDGIQECYVEYSDGEFKYISGPASPELKNFVETLQTDLNYEFPAGYNSEICFWYQPWLKSLAASLQTGVVLLIDYGYTQSEYYHPQRNQGTLICNYRHHAHDNPFVLFGLQDISAFVDFSSVANYAHAAGLNLAGYCPQAQFLIGCGLDEIAQSYLQTQPDDFLKIAQEIKQLTLPGEMGERFKVIGLCKNYEENLRGFHNFDQSHRL